jgi:hypothetical protein
VSEAVLAGDAPDATEELKARMMRQIAKGEQQ